MTASDKSGTLLIVEDDPGLQRQLHWCFEQYEVVEANDRESALSAIRRYEPPVVTLDLGLPPDPANATEGFATLGEIVALSPQTKVIVVTGNGQRENAVRAIGMGAYDFYEKPVEPEILSLIVARAFRLHELESENRRLAQSLQEAPLEGVIAVSPEMTKVCAAVEKVAPTNATILLLGESGTGKELLARALHQLSARRNESFVVINCAAIPETLLESELFGYEKGAFTGAHKQTIGKIESAHEGTLFLDEIGDLPQSLQAKLLRFLQERTIERLGGRQQIEVDVRIVCATHQDLVAKIDVNDFREDLYYRISEVTLKVPALRERAGDVVVLANAFLEQYNREAGRPKRRFSEEALAAIESYRWPGNIRELGNRIKRASIMADQNVIGAHDLELEATVPDALPVNLKCVREEAEKRAVTRAMALADNSVSRAADLLGITRPTLYNLLEKYGLR